MFCKDCGLEIGEDVKICPECSKIVTDDRKKIKVCRLVTASVICLLLFILFIALANAAAELNSQYYPVIEIVLTGLGIYCVGGSIMLAILGRIRIALSDGRLKGRKGANAIIFVICFFTVIQTYEILYPIETHHMYWCKNNLRELGKYIEIYSNEHAGLLPAGENWCDAIITGSDIGPDSFQCRLSRTIEGESSYALNENVIGKKYSEIPGDMVLLFETNQGKSKDAREYLLKNRKFTLESGKYYSDPEKHMVFKDRWNQFGGPELLAIHHSKNNNPWGVNVLFADGRVEFIKVRHLKDIKNLVDLRWSVEGNKVSADDFYEIKDLLLPNPNFPVIPVMFIGVIIGLLTISTAIKYRIKDCVVFSFLLAIPSVAIGAIFGSWGGVVYRPDEYALTGAYCGALLGLCTALCYVPFYVHIQKKITRKKFAGELGIALGMLAGAICSTILHGILLLVYDNLYWAMLLGLPFGILGGSVLGVVAAVVVCVRYRRGDISTVVECSDVTGNWENL